MSKYGPTHTISGPAAPDTEVMDFEPEIFPRANDARPIPDPDQDFQKDAPPLPPAPSHFEEFVVEQKPLSELMKGLPSLDGLFKPFNLESVGPVEQAPYEDLCDLQLPQNFVFEEMDTRNQDVVRTLAQAEEVKEQIRTQAEEDRAAVLETAHTEARGLLADARAKAEEQLEEVNRQVTEKLAGARETRQQLDEELIAAKASRQQGEEELKTAREQLASLDQEKAAVRTEKETIDSRLAAKKAELEAEHQKQKAEFESTLEATREATFNQAQTDGHTQGHQQGFTEGQDQGRQAFQEQIEGFLAIMAKMNNLYYDLWQANGPMMIKLAIEAAQEILNKELLEAEDLAARTFEACIDFLSRAHRVTFIARPQDLAQLQEARAEHRQRLGALVQISFKGDDTLGPGDLIMESDVGRLDATVKHRATQVLEVLRVAYQEAHEGKLLPRVPLLSEDLTVISEEEASAISAEGVPEGSAEGEAAPAASTEAAPETPLPVAPKAPAEAAPPPAAPKAPAEAAPPPADTAVSEANPPQEKIDP